MQETIVKRRPFAHVVLGAFAAGVLGGCGIFGDGAKDDATNNEHAAAIVRARVVGLQAGEFFDRYGHPTTRDEMADGSTQFDWSSTTSLVIPGQYELDDHICKLRITADPRGRITAVLVVFDPQGLTGGSRCTELFTAK